MLFLCLVCLSSGKDKFDKTFDYVPNMYLPNIGTMKLPKKIMKQYQLYPSYYTGSTGYDPNSDHFQPYSFNPLENKKANKGHNHKDHGGKYHKDGKHHAKDDKYILKDEFKHQRKEDNKHLKEDYKKHKKDDFKHYLYLKYSGNYNHEDGLDKESHEDESHDEETVEAKSLNGMGFNVTHGGLTHTSNWEEYPDYYSHLLTHLLGYNPNAPLEPYHAHGHNTTSHSSRRIAIEERPRFRSELTGQHAIHRDDSQILSLIESQGPTKADQLSKLLRPSRPFYESKTVSSERSETPSKYENKYGHRPVGYGHYRGIPLARDKFDFANASFAQGSMFEDAALLNLKMLYERSSDNLAAKGYTQQPYLRRLRETDSTLQPLETFEVLLQVLQKPDLIRPLINNWMASLSSIGHNGPENVETLFDLTKKAQYIYDMKNDAAQKLIVDFNTILDSYARFFI